jgi:hypothetical protein
VGFDPSKRVSFEEFIRLSALEPGALDDSRIMEVAKDIFALIWGTHNDQCGQPIEPQDEPKD